MFEILEHTADVGFRIHGRDLNELFAEAARALVSLMVENPETIQATRWIDCQLTDERLDDLLLDWLGAVLHCFERDHLVLGRFEVSVECGSLRARAGGEELDLSRHRPRYEIKAVTYHGLKVLQTPTGWMAEVIVDI